MATTIYVPPALLQAVDRLAAKLKLSRNRFIVQAIVQAVDRDTAWSDRFRSTLCEAHGDQDLHATVEEMRQAIIAKRFSKKPPPELE